MSLIAELKRRNVIRMAGLYLVGAWLLVQVAGTLLPVFEAPAWVMKTLVGLLAVGFVPALVFSWVFELTPAGLKRDSEVAPEQSIAPQTARRMDRTIIVVLALALAYFAFDKFVLGPRREEARTAPADTAQQAPAPTTAKRSIAVLPFVNMSGEAENEFFSDGLSEEILNSLARIDTMQVVGRTSSFLFKGKTEDLRKIGEKLGVANVLEGSVRRSGDHARITAQLVRTLDGIHLWSQTYDRTLSDTLAVQLDIAEHVAGVLDVVMDEAQRARMREAGVKNVDAFIALQKGRRLYEDAHDPLKSDDLIAGLRVANVEFARAVELEPDLALAHFLATDLYEHQIFSDATTSAERASALQSALAELDLAIRATHDPDQRRSIEVDRQLLSDDWRGLGPRIEAVAATMGCGEIIWAQQLGFVFGFAPQFEARAQRKIACDPLDYTPRARLAEATNWAGHPERTLAAVAEAERATGESSDFLKGHAVRALLALGRFDEARSMLATLPQRGELNALVHLLAAAALGADSSTLGRLWQQTDRSQSRLGAWTVVAISVAAVRGDRSEANRLAATLDAQPAGPLLLSIVTEVCVCGAPFDLDATPRFKARIAEAGLPWPPPELIRFPLKSAAEAKH